LNYSTFDIKATMDYASRVPMKPTFLFTIDVSKPAIESGYVEAVASTIRNVIEGDQLPGGDDAKIGFITYDSSLHFYNLRSTLKQA
jgi:protein transport protein SEC24